MIATIEGAAQTRQQIGDLRVIADDTIDVLFRCHFETVSRDARGYFGLIRVILLPWMPIPAIRPSCAKTKA